MPTKIAFQITFLKARLISLPSLKSTGRSRWYIFLTSLAADWLILVICYTFFFTFHMFHQLKVELVWYRVCFAGSSSAQMTSCSSRYFVSLSVDLSESNIHCILISPLQDESGRTPGDSLFFYHFCPLFFQFLMKKNIFGHLVFRIFSFPGRSRFFRTLWTWIDFLEGER